MKTTKTFYFSLFFIALTFCKLNAQTYQWAHGFSSTFYANGGKIKTDASGNIYNIGNYGGTVDFDPSPTATVNLTSGNAALNGFISKYTSNGLFSQALKITSMNNSSTCLPMDIVIDGSQNMYVTGVYEGSVDFDPTATNTIIASAGGSDFFIAKYNANGTLAWVQSIGGINDDFSNSLALDASSANVVVVGAFNGSNIDFNVAAGTSTLTSNGYDGFILKLNASTGNFNSVIKFGGVGNDQGTAIKIDGSNNIYVGGTFASSAAFSGISYSSGLDAFFAKYSSSLSLTWAKGIGGPNNESLTGLEIDGTGNIYSCGSFSQSGDFDPSAAILTFTSSSSTDIDGFILKSDNSGSLLWASQIGASGNSQPNSISVDASGNVYTAGNLFGSADFDPSSTFAYLASAGNFDIFVHKLSSNGNYLQTQLIGGGNREGCKGLVVNSGGDYIISGSLGEGGTTDVTTDFNTTALTNTVSGKFYIAKYSTCSYPSLPVNSTIVANQTICTGSNAALSISSSTNTVNWFPSYTSTTSVSNSANYTTPTVTNNTSYYVTHSNSCGTSPRVPIDVTVVQNPTVTINPTSPAICAGSSVILTAGGANTYTWMPGSITGNTLQVSNPSSNTTYTLLGKNNVCASISNAVKTVTVKPLPIISATINSSNTAVCFPGNNVVLLAGGNSGYTWTPGNLSGTAISVSPTSPTTYTVQSTLNGCIGNATVFVGISSTPTVSISNPVTIACSGKTFTLTANGASTYTWSSSFSNASSIVVSPVNTTTYSVRGANIEGCTSTTTVYTLTVNPTPTISTTSSNSIICSGKSSTLTAIGAATYTWLPGSLVGGTVTVNPSTTTTYTVNASSAAGCTNTAISSVSVNTTPTITVNNGAICVGGSFTITPTGANTYTISGGSYVVSPTSTNSYSVTGTSSQGCVSSNTAISTVSVQSSLTVSIAGTNTVCNGSPINLTANGAATYTWSTGSTNHTIAPSPSSNTTYTVTGASGTCSSSAVKSITVNPTPTVSAVTSTSLLCTGNNAILTASGASNYNWLPGSLTGSTISINPTSNTTYTVTGTNSFGCSDVSVITQSVSLCTSIENMTTNFSSVNFYPNPFNEIITIESELPVSKIILRDVLGKEVSTIEKINNEKHIHLSTNEFPEGIYFMTVFIDNQNKTYKIIKK
jgi:hypothetical protein